MDETKPFGIIYKITSPSGKSYIGQTTQTLEERMSEYRRLKCKEQPKIYRAILKYGWENMIYELMCSCDSREELDFKESELIKSFNSVNEGYNCLEGRINHKLPEYIRKIVKDCNSGERNPMFGKKHTKESLDKMKSFQRERWSNEALRAEMITRISSANKGRPSKVKDLTIYHFLNFRTKESFVGTQTDFYQKYNLHSAWVSPLAKEKVLFSGDWVLAKNEHKISEILKRRAPSNKSSKFTYKNELTGEIFIGNQCQFRKRFSLHKTNVSKLSLGKSKKYKNWILLDSSPEKR